jgi:hypothetical protein
VSRQAHSTRKFPGKATDHKVVGVQIPVGLAGSNNHGANEVGERIPTKPEAKLVFGRREYEHGPVFDAFLADGNAEFRDFSSTLSLF